MELAGKTMGIVGFGRIGRQTARIADALGMRVIASDAVPADVPPYTGFRWACTRRAAERIRRGEPARAAAPGDARDDQRAHAQALMKPSAFLINTSRGALVDAADLAEALNDGRLAGAALDVLADEPPPAEIRCLRRRICLVTPHMAWATREARERLMDAAVENVASFPPGRPRNVVS